MFLEKLLKDKFIFQAPMAGYSDRAFRHICIDYGCPVTTTEMVSTEEITRNGEKTFELMYLSDNESNDMRIVQLFGQNPSSYSKSAEILLKKYSPLHIDINAGCSVKKVIKTGSGVALMADLKKTYKIIKAIKDVDNSIFVSIKFRLGLKHDNINYLDFADNAVQAGAQCLILHPRSASQAFTGSANHLYTKKLKEKFPQTFVVASGDVFTYADAIKIKSETSADAVMIARGLIGNPFIFAKKNREDFSYDERIKALYKHYDLLKYYEGESKAKNLIRKFIKGYAHSIPNFTFNY